MKTMKLISVVLLYCSFSQTALGSLADLKTKFEEFAKNGAKKIEGLKCSRFENPIDYDKNNKKRDELRTFLTESKWDALNEQFATEYPTTYVTDVMKSALYDKANAVTEKKALETSLKEAQAVEKISSDVVKKAQAAFDAAKTNLENAQKTETTNLATVKGISDKIATQETTIKTQEEKYSNDKNTEDSNRAGALQAKHDAQNIAGRINEFLNCR